MRSLTFGLALLYALGFSLLSQLYAQPRPPGPAAPEGPDAAGHPNPRLFQLQMCSHAPRQRADIYVATAAAAPPPGQAVADGSVIEVQGWWRIPVNQCANLGSFPRPGIFAYAMALNGQVFWSNPEPQLCVNTSARFDYKFNPDIGRPCRGAEEAKGFFQVAIAPDSASKKFTLN
jgi:hypothetical protein